MTDAGSCNDKARQEQEERPLFIFRMESELDKSLRSLHSLLFRDNGRKETVGDDKGRRHGSLGGGIFCHPHRGPAHDHDDSTDDENDNATSSFLTADSPTLASTTAAAVVTSSRSPSSQKYEARNGVQEVIHPKDLAVSRFKLQLLPSGIKPGCGIRGDSDVNLPGLVPATPSSCNSDGKTAVVSENELISPDPFIPAIGRNDSTNDANCWADDGKDTDHAVLSDDAATATAKGADDHSAGDDEPLKSVARAIFVGIEETDVAVSIDDHEGSVETTSLGERAREGTFSMASRGAMTEKNGNMEVSNSSAKLDGVSHAFFIFRVLVLVVLGLIALYKYMGQDSALVTNVDSVVTKLRTTAGTAVGWSVPVGIERIMEEIASTTKDNDLTQHYVALEELLKETYTYTQAHILQNMEEIQIHLIHLQNNLLEKLWNYQECLDEAWRNSAFSTDFDFSEYHAQFNVTTYYSHLERAVNATMALETFLKITESTVTATFGEANVELFNKTWIEMETSLANLVSNMTKDYMESGIQEYFANLKMQLTSAIGIEILVTKWEQIESNLTNYYRESGLQHYFHQLSKMSAGKVHTSGYENVVVRSSEEMASPTKGHEAVKTDREENYEPIDGPVEMIGGQQLPPSTDMVEDEAAADVVEDKHKNLADPFSQPETTGQDFIGMVNNSPQQVCERAREDLLPSLNDLKSVNHDSDIIDDKVTVAVADMAELLTLRPRTEPTTSTVDDGDDFMSSKLAAAEEPPATAGRRQGATSFSNSAFKRRVPVSLKLRQTNRQLISDEINYDRSGTWPGQLIKEVDEGEGTNGIVLLGNDDERGSTMTDNDLALDEQKNQQVRDG